MTCSSLLRSHEALSDPEVSGRDKKRFVSRLREELEEIRGMKRGRPEPEDVARIAGQLREFVAGKNREEDG